ncbi:putative non-specific serine/threonine protein kinase [Rosa chinensis]|uniref:Putative non-specific serine/threonine protein kinase n=1 Tax=Rosa chinensis TaxID=74649 RepID=A0A2P6QAR4_ROSCH|nr:putative non-specific serine/threonine protein kinase [Rosa chinensis]
MNPKIADFGITRLLLWIKLKEIQRPLLGPSNGYMAPEYVIHGRFSVK